MSARLKGRRREVERLTLDLPLWASARDDVEAVVLVGSYARGHPRMGSDVDLLIISSRVEWLAEDMSWFPSLRPGSTLIRTRMWGALLERRYRLPSGLQVELGLVSPSWLELPLDSGTRRVLLDGHTVLYDADGLARRAADALGVVRGCRGESRQG